jgi:hypothetical protein
MEEHAEACSSDSSTPAAMEHRLPTSDKKTGFSLPRAYYMFLPVALEHDIQLRLGAQISPVSLGFTAQEQSRCKRSDQNPQGSCRFPFASGDSLPTVVDATFMHFWQTSASPSARKVDASPSRPLFPLGGLMEQSNASLQRGRQG